MKKQSTGKRLVLYAAQFKKTILIALLLLSVAVAAELSGPFIAKKVIDEHILGIEKPWYEASHSDKNTVEFEGKLYKRGTYFLQDEEKGPQVSIVQIGRNFYFLNQPVNAQGERTVKDGILTIVKNGKSVAYPVKKLTKDEIMNFYKPEIDNILLLFSIYLGLILFASFFQYGKSYLLQASAHRIIQKMRKDVFAQIQRVPINYFDNRPAGKIVSRITNDTEAILELYIKVLASFFTSGIYLAGIYIALFLLDAKLALITTILIPILAIWIIIYRKYASKYNKVIRARLSDINGIINESIQGMPIIHAFRKKEATNKEFSVLNDEYFTYQNKLLSLNSLTSHNLVNVLRTSTLVLLIWYFGGKSIGGLGIISIGVLYAFVDYLNRLFQPVTDIVNQLASLEQARVAADRVFELMDENGVDVASGSTPINQGNVKFDHVFFAYQEDEYVLRDINFEAKKGETVALVGHTGSGKSSIMNLLFRFYDVNKGSVKIDGIDIREMPRQHLRKHMGIVLQDPFLFTGTITSNVSLQDPSITKEKVIKALKDVGAEAFIKRLPKQYDEPVIEKGSTLSAGERQLISFARALAFDPTLLILDEATANIDTETESIIQDALEVLKKGRTTFIIAHRLSTIKNADQILVLDHGEIVERGNHEELMELGGRYYQMYQTQQGIQANMAG